jgi:hypothetical protein
VRLRVVLSAAAVAVATAAILAVPAVRGTVVELLHLADDAARAEPIMADGRVVGHTNLRITAQPAPPQPALQARPVKVTANGFFSWALLDRQTGAIDGSSNHTAGTNTTESMIKAWIASDYLRVLGNKKPTTQRLAQLTRMIRDSDDKAAQDIYRVNGGNSVIRRAISTCGLTDSTIRPGWWSGTKVTARDAVRLGLCVADGRAAGPKWTSWVLAEMRQVRGPVTLEPSGGRWGIIDGLPPEMAAEVSIKNGWTMLFADGQWHVNCLAIHADWVLAVLSRYPQQLGKQYGAGLCKQVTQQLLTTAP